jgi:hypothetical protein
MKNINKEKLMKKYFPPVVMALALILLFAAGACKSSTTSTTPATTRPGSGAVINSDSIVTAQIQSITAQSTGYPWKMNVLIQSTTNVGDVPNPVSDSIGKVVTVVTDEDMSVYKVNDVVTAKIKYVGDVNIPAGISLYMYNAALQTTPGY